jgi:hypothetical protein
MDPMQRPQDQQQRNQEHDIERGSGQSQRPGNQNPQEDRPGQGGERQEQGGQREDAFRPGQQQTDEPGKSGVSQGGQSNR